MFNRISRERSGNVEFPFLFPLLVARGGLSKFNADFVTN